MTDTKYTVYDHNADRVVGAGLTVTEAADEVLNSYSKPWEVRKDSDGAGWSVWRHNLHGQWAPACLYSLEADHDAAREDIARKIIVAGLDRHVTVMTDDEFAAMQRRLEQENEV